MWLLRFIGLLCAFGVLTCVAAYFVSGRRQYLRYALKVVSVAVCAALLFFIVLILERL